MQNARECRKVRSVALLGGEGMSAAPQIIDRSLFSTSALSERDKYDAWESSISAVFDVNPTEDTLGTFEAEVESYMIGPMMLAQCKTNGQAFSRDKRTIARHNMDHILIQFYLEGGNLLRTPNGVVLSEVGDIQIIDMAQELDSVANPASRKSDNTIPTFTNMSLVVARDRLEALMPALHRFHLHVFRSSSPLNLILRNYVMTMFTCASELTHSEAEALVEPTVELLAATINRELEQDTGTNKALDVATLITVKQFIDNNLHVPTLNPDTIAKHLGISRASLFRICNPFGGVMGLVRSRRLLVARRLLSTSPVNKSIKSIMYGLGFNDRSSFNRAYKQQFGISPSETQDYVLENLASKPDPLIEGTAIGDRKYEFWIANLVS